MSPCPKITVVTPCYNAENNIERSILSILSQRYENLEYIVVDGFSTDHTIDVIEKYRDRITCVIHEPDKGMYDAIRKGFARATGDVLCWLNADDQSMPWTLRTIGEIFENHPDVDWVMGVPAFLNEKYQLTKIYTQPAAIPRKYIQNGWCRSDVRGLLQQENMFWRRSLYERAGGIDSSYRAAGDFELWTRFARYADLATVDIPFSAFMKRADSLSRRDSTYEDEVETILRGRKKYPSFLWKIGAKVSVIRALMRLLVHYKTPLIYYSERRQCFTKINSWRNVSGNSLSEIIRYVLHK